MNIEVLASGQLLAEAPVWRSDGTVLWSDVLGGGVHVLAADGSTAVLVPERTGIGGMVLTDDRRVVVTGRSLVVVADDGTVTELAARPDGTTGINDVTATPDGDVLVGLLTFRPFAGDEPTPGLLGRRSPGSDHIRTVRTGLVWPNGIAVRNDGTIVVADFHDGRLWRGNDLDDLEPFTTVPGGHADGLALDRDGMVWVAGGPAATATRMTIDGDVDATLQLDPGFVSSVAFAEPGELLVTRMGPDDTPSLVRIAVDAAGAPIPTATA